MATLRPSEEGAKVWVLIGPHLRKLRKPVMPLLNLLGSRNLFLLSLLNWLVQHVTVLRICSQSPLNFAGPQL
jgi:hypothetical protein